MVQELIRVRADNGQDYFLDDAAGTVKQRDAAGRLVNIADLNTRDLGIGDVHIPSAMANYAAGYKQGPAVAEIVAPVVLSEKASDYYFTFDKDDALQSAQTTLAAEGDRLPEISPRLSNSTFTTQPYGLAAFIPQGVIANADSPLNPRMAAMNRMLNAMSLAREQRTAAALMNATTFSGFTSAIAAGSKWNGGADSDPVADIHLGIETALQDINQILMAENVWHAFVRNSNVAKFGMYKDGANVTPGALSALLGLPEIVIARMKGKSASAGTYGYVWGSGCLLLHNPPGVPADQQSIATSKTFRWSKGEGMGSIDGGFRVRSWFDPNRGQDGGEMLAVAVNEVPVVTAPATGYLLTACVQ